MFILWPTTMILDETDISTDAAINGTTAAVAWPGPHIPQLDGSRNVTNTYGLTDEVELFGILGTIQTIQNMSRNDARKFRIITDSHVALRELNRTYSPFLRPRTSSTKSETSLMTGSRYAWSGPLSPHAERTETGRHIMLPGSVYTILP